MASAQAFNRVSTRHLFQPVIVPDAHSAAQYPLWVDMMNFKELLVQIILAVKGSSGGVATFEITASDAADGSTNKTQIKSGAIIPVTAGDNAFLECQVEEINAIGRAAGVALRYASVKITTLVAADVVVATYVGNKPRFPRSGLTTTLIQ